MVLALTENCRKPIEDEYGSIIEFKKIYYRFCTIVQQGTLTEIYKAMNQIAKVYSEAMQKASEEILRALKSYCGNMSESMKPLLKSYSDLLSVSRKTFCTQWSFPKTPNIVLKYEKVSIEYFPDIRNTAIHRPRNNC